MSSSPEPARTDVRQYSRGLDVLTAVLLGVVSLTTALGAWQATTWNRQADGYAASSSDARDVSIASGVAWQYDSRLDSGAILNARKYALLEDAAIAAGDPRDSAYYNVMVGNYLGRILSEGLPEAFDTWRDAGFPADQNPTTDPVYQANLRGTSDAYSVVSTLAGGFKDALQGKAAIFAQAALIDALALFLLGVAGINRLRTARFATLVLGGAAYLASLMIMATAY
ncbi:MAG TPA: hypothetical protein VGO65_01490 [Pseudolysinimonas sp.]|nr:hypothetical protein [Schumannella sp.]HEV7741069.1 hypothetical protein [Pseudolysinimonas sp.]